ncbi:PepSY domain-containing protein [Alkalihalobacillus sp. TS-13]|uniref:PepSY domain-containing protein n=1 Tax=Alkalihalobacillus sp. TS-13 TaxID=2842455 RepID=UPI001C88A06E|nr:PepSY domain-containing protein [Alkalihalobacillus sp. TS-13]
MKKKIIMFTLAGTLAIGGVGAVKAMDDDEVQETKKVVLANEGEKGSQSEMISLSEAEEIALKEVEGKVDEVEFEEEHGQQVYKVDVEGKDDHEVHIDASTGKVLTVKKDDGDDDDRDDLSSADKENLIGKDEAIKIALKEAAGKVTEVELDEDDGQYVYEIEIKMADKGEADIEISATDGKVIETEIDRDDD